MAGITRDQWKKVGLLVALLVLPTLIFYFFVYNGVHHVARLPFYGPRHMVQREYRGKMIMDTLYHEIRPFILLRPDSTPFDGRRLDGKIYVANFLDYSKLDTIPKEVVYVAAEVLDRFPEVYFVTHFEHYQGQTLPQPSSFTKKLEGKDSSWVYLIGPQNWLDSLRQTGYFVEDPDLKWQKDPFSLVLVDKEKRIRGYYNPILAKDSKRIVEEIEYLKKEYKLDYRTHRYFEYDEKVEQKRNK